MMILIIVHLWIETQMFLQWVFYTNLKIKNSGIKEAYKCFWHVGKINVHILGGDMETNTDIERLNCLRV